MTCDGTFDVKLDRSAAASVLLNRSISIVDEIAKKIIVSSPLVSEAIAIREACDIAEC